MYVIAVKKKKTLQWFVNSNFFYKHSLKDEEGLNSCGSLKYGKLHVCEMMCFIFCTEERDLIVLVSSPVVSHLYCILHCVSVFGGDYRVWLLLPVKVRASCSSQSPVYLIWLVLFCNQMIIHTSVKDDHFQFPGSSISMLSWRKSLNISKKNLPFPWDAQRS